MKKILAFLFLTAFTAPALTAQVTAPEPVGMRKTAEVPDDDKDRVKLTLESFVCGNNVASDIAIAMDMSISMGHNVGSSGEFYTLQRKLTEETKVSNATKGKTATAKTMSATTKAATRKNSVSANNRNWTYNNLATQNYPFYLYEGEYYRVQRGNDLGPSGNIRALWIDTPDGRKYLSGSSLSDEPGNVTANGTTIYSGNLYNGYTWANIVAGTTAGETTVSYLYNGEYYPVKRNRFDADGTRNDSGAVYALWIDTPDGVKFLYGSGLRDQLDPSITANTYYLFYGDVYDGGWTYDGINGPWYYDYNGTYYPVHKSLESSSYTLWISVNGNRMYLKGEGLSDHFLQSVNASTSSIYFGSLYNGGWCYNDISSNYNYMYGGNYYLVQRGRFNTDGTPNAAGSLYAIYIEMGGTRKFLSGNGLQDSPYELVTTPGTAATCSVFSGTLYSGGWTYSDITGDNVYYYLLNGNYYPVKRSNDLADGQGGNDARALWIEVGGQRTYLKDESLADDYMPSIVSDSQAIFYGTLYSGGWTYSNLSYGNADGNANNQWYYLLNGEYYPVRRANNLGGGSVCAMWICEDYQHPENRKYLSGQGLADDFDPSVTSADQVIYLGTLYKGWCRDDINDGVNNKKFYYKQGNQHYLIKRETVSSTYQLYVEIDDNKYYLNGTTVTAEINPYAANQNNISLFFGDLYFKRSQLRRADYLKQAMDSLLTNLAKDAMADGLQHRVALLEFSAAKWADGNTTLERPFLDTSPLDGLSAHIISDFKDITVPANVAALKDAMAIPGSFSSNSHYEYGFALADGMFQRELGSTAGTDLDQNGVTADFELPTLSGQDHDKYPSRPRIFILIGDCEPTNEGSANSAAEAIKESPSNAHTFVVLVNDDKGTGTHAPLTLARKWATRDELVSQVDEFDETLVATMEGLSKEIRKALIDLGPETVMQDVIAEGFEIPDEDNDIKVYTADYLSGKDRNDMEFQRPADLIDLTDPGCPFTLTVTRDANDRQVVSVSGLDYSENYCGSIAGVRHGKELILEITVRRTKAAGGPSTVTNVAETSGLKYSADGAFLGNFTSPVTHLPVTIEIRKYGLAKGESAVFTVAPVDENGDPVTSAGGTDVKPVRVILTGNASGTYVTAFVKHLNSDCHWLVSEEGWSWDYKVGDFNVNDVTPTLSTLNQTFNPFVFTNVKQGTTIRSAESKVTNDFSSGSATTVQSHEL